MSHRTKLSKNWGVISLAMLAMLVAVLVLNAFAHAGSKATVAVARVQSVRGQLLVRHQGAKVYVPLKAGQAVFGGDIVRTGAGSRAIILLTNRAELELGANMAMEIPLPAEPAKLLPRERSRSKDSVNR